MSGLVKHDDSDTAQRSSQVHALIKYAARQVSSILTSLDAFTRLLFIWPPSQIENNSYSVIRTREKKINRGKKVNTVAETKQFPTGGKRVLAGDFRSTENTTGFRIYS